MMTLLVHHVHLNFHEMVSSYPRQRFTFYRFVLNVNERLRVVVDIFITAQLHISARILLRKLK